MGLLLRPILLSFCFKFQFRRLTNLVFEDLSLSQQRYIFNLLDSNSNEFASSCLIRQVDFFDFYSWYFRYDLYESRIGDHINSPLHLISHGSVITNVTLIPIKITKTKITKFLSVLFRAIQTMSLRNPFMITIPAILLDILVDTFLDKLLDIPSRRYPTADLIQLQCEK